MATADGAGRGEVPQSDDLGTWRRLPPSPTSYFDRRRASSAYPRPPSRVVSYRMREDQLTRLADAGNLRSLTMTETLRLVVDRGLESLAQDWTDEQTVRHALSHPITTTTGADLHISSATMTTSPKRRARTTTTKETP